MTFSVVSYQLSAVLDTGCEASIVSTQLYNELRANGVEILELPTQNVVLVGAFSRKTHHVKKQVIWPCLYVMALPLICSGQPVIGKGLPLICNVQSAIPELPPILMQSHNFLRIAVT